MKRLVTALCLTLVAAVAGAQPATAGERPIDWGIANWVAGVQMTTSFPTASDPQVHVRFKRVGGDGQRQVRMGERHKVEGSHRWTRYTYTRAVKLRVGQKVVFTTQRALPCEPAREPLGLVVDMRIKQPGKPWSAWQTWISEDHFLLDCAEQAQEQP